MPFVSVTRLRIRSLRYLPSFALATVAAQRQARRSGGYHGGTLLSEPKRAFWTVTMWDDQASMKAFRDHQAHGRAMPRLRRWCDEASVVHWEQEGHELPEPTECRRRMTADGRLSRVEHPSVTQREGRIDPSVVRKGPGLAPRRRA